MTDLKAIVSAALADRYTFEGDVGQGGMATVYRARDLRHGSSVAIKVLRPELVVALGGERFTREVRITAALQHPNILPLLDSGEADGLPYYVMPFVDGASLAQRLAREGPLPIDEAVQYVAEIADGLAYAHSKGLIHRDLKPANILLSQGHALLADFGVARVLDTTGGDVLTDSGLALGTAAYMSPEQAAGERVDKRADIYALGCVLYELLTGSPPFTGASQRQIMARHAVDPVPSVRTVRREVPQALEAAIAKALAKTPGDRFADAAEFRKAILIGQSSPVLEAVPSRSDRNRVLGGFAVTAVLAVLAIVLARRPAPAALDEDRVMVYPLVLPAGWKGSASAGEDVSTMIGSAMDGAGALRWIDGWQLLPPALRDNMRALSDSGARALARLHRCRYFITGRIAVHAADSAEVLLTLNDLTKDAPVKQQGAFALASEAWRAGLRAVTTMLPSLIRSGQAKPDQSWADRNPQAVASFLAGEAAFRRVQVEQALTHYKAAVASDSAFGLAALHGAQAAEWVHRNDDAIGLARLATKHARTPRERAFAAGLTAFLVGHADSAVTALRAALALDPAMAVAWMQLGETYIHLLPSRGNTDSLAADALRHALALDSGATHFLFHEVQLVARAGEAKRTDSLARRFVASAQDSSLVAEVAIIADCVRGQFTTSAARTVATRTPRALQSALKALGLRYAGCVLAGDRMLLEVDTANTGEADGRRFFALVALVQLHVARGQPDSAVAEIERFLARWKQGSSLYPEYATVVPAFAARARQVAAEDSAKAGIGFRGLPYTSRLWVEGVWAAMDGRLAMAQGAADEMALRAARDHRTMDSVMAASLRAHVTLAAGDSAGALAQLTALIARPVPRDEVSWTDAASLGLERLQLARLLMARRRFADARAVLEVLDSYAPASFPLFAPVALRLRADASDAMGDAETAGKLRKRASIVLP
ncbi:MAG: serine/threonine protein kinase [Gemmatimonadetes bacterium]|nr:serine/threonine protein kinase [Gemmatimonadota bacterium]